MTSTKKYVIEIHSEKALFSKVFVRMTEETYHDLYEALRLSGNIPITGKGVIVYEA